MLGGDLTGIAGFFGRRRTGKQNLPGFRSRTPVRAKIAADMAAVAPLFQG
jgi:hypothetical protein